MTECKPSATPGDPVGLELEDFWEEDICKEDLCKEDICKANIGKQDICEERQREHGYCSSLPSLLCGSVCQIDAFQCWFRNNK